MFLGKKNNKNEECNLILPLLPLRDIVIFPHMIVPLFVGRPRSVKAVETAMSKHNNQIVLCAQITANVDDPTEADIYKIGTIGEVLQVLKLPDGTIKVLIEASARIKTIEYTRTDEYFEVACHCYEPDTSEENKKK